MTVTTTVTTTGAAVVVGVAFVVGAADFGVVFAVDFGVVFGVVFGGDFVVLADAVAAASVVSTVRASGDEVEQPATSNAPTASAAVIPSEFLIQRNVVHR